MILAAGESKRMGRPKLLMRYRNGALIEQAIAAAARWDPLVVASPVVAAFLEANSNVDVIINTEPELGMTHSLALADGAILRDTPLIVLLADKPLVTSKLIAHVCGASQGTDVVWPRHPRTGEPGHPVRLSADARKKISSLPAGDSLRQLRDEPALSRRALAVSDEGAYFDVDAASALTFARRVACLDDGARPRRPQRETW